MELRHGTLTIVCDMGGQVVRGEVVVGENNRVSDLLNQESHSQQFLALTSVSVFDDQHRLVARHRFMSLNKRFIRTVVEDDVAPVLAEAKHHLAREDHEKAWEALEPLMSTGSADAETFYLAGITARGRGHGEAGVEYFRKARALTLEEAFRNIINRHLAELE